MELEAFVALVKNTTREVELAVVALSGGVDSGLAAYGAHQAFGKRAVAATVVSD